MCVCVSRYWFSWWNIWQRHVTLRMHPEALSPLMLIVWWRYTFCRWVTGLNAMHRHDGDLMFEWCCTESGSYSMSAGVGMEWTQKAWSISRWLEYVLLWGECWVLCIEAHVLTFWWCFSFFRMWASSRLCGSQMHHLWISLSRICSFDSWNIIQRSFRFPIMSFAVAGAQIWPDWKRCGVGR